MSFFPLATERKKIGIYLFLLFQSDIEAYLIFLNFLYTTVDLNCKKLISLNLTVKRVINLDGMCLWYQQTKHETVERATSIFK